jgi:hypothetical protein
MIGDVSKFVKLATLDRNPVSEALANRLANALAAVDHEQQRVILWQTSIQEIPEQCPSHGGVLGAPLPNAQNVFAPILADSKGDERHVVCEADPVDHHDPEVEIIEPTAQTLADLALAQRDEPPRHGASRLAPSDIALRQRGLKARVVAG